MNKLGKALLKIIYGPIGLIILSVFIILLWFNKGLLFAGGEEGLAFYNPDRSLNLSSYLWYDVGTGFYQLINLARLPFLTILTFLYNLGVSSLFLEAATFFLMFAIGTLSVYFLMQILLQDLYSRAYLKKISLISAIFYLLNPFSTTQIWGRGLFFLFFSFALIPLFLLLFILALQKRNLIFILLAALSSFILSLAYSNPSMLLTSWISVFIYFVFYLYSNRKKSNNIVFASVAFVCLGVVWVSINFFSLNPLLHYGKDFLNLNVNFRDNILSLEGVSSDSSLSNLLRLVHREYYDGTYGGFFQTFLFVILTWLIPVAAIFSLSSLKKSKQFLFLAAFFAVSVFFSLGSNFPTGMLFEFLFRKLTFLQVLRNPYEKFGINLLLAYLPFFSVGIVVISEKIGNLLKILSFKTIILAVFIFLICVIEVWPIWNGQFAVEEKSNFWVKVPDYYKETDAWISAQAGDFYTLHVPLIPEDGITFTWNHPFEGIEPSEFLFSKPAIARNFYDNRDYYSVLLERFGWDKSGNYNPVYLFNDKEGVRSKDFREKFLYQELSKLNVRFIILHHDIDYRKRRAKSPEETAEYLAQQERIRKIRSFGELDIYQVDVDPKIDLIYSPDAEVAFQKINNALYIVNVKNNKEKVDILFLKQFDKNWAAYLDNKEIDNHSRVFSFANMWTIDKTGEFQIKIKYKPQDTVDFGMKVSISSLSIMFIVLLFYLLKIRKLIFK